jgi:hypothetical protein
MGLLRRKADDDDITSTLLDNGVFHIGESHKKKRKRHDSVSPYSFWGAVKYASILTFLLWWLPIIGPVVSGYVCGRRAGRPWIGVLAALVPLLVLSGLTLFLRSEYVGWQLSTETLYSYVVSLSPSFGPYVDFATQYMDLYIGAIQVGTGVFLDVYILTLAFAYIGGALALQNWREMDYVSENGGEGMTVMFNNGSRKSKTRPNGGIFKPHAAAKPVKAKRARSAKGFSQMQSISDEEEEDQDVTSPVDRGVDRADIDFVSSSSRAKHNVKAMRRAAASSAGHQKAVNHSGKVRAARAKDLDEESGQGDWRFI